MENDEARALLAADRAEVTQLLADAGSAGAEDRSAEQETGDMEDPAQAFTAEGVDDAIAAGLRDRLAALDRADARLAAETYGLSVRSGEPIPDERLRANPSAELTVAEAEADA